MTVERDLELSLGFDDVGIRQNFSTIESRLDVDTTTEVVRGINIKVPLLASNMSTVTNADFCNKIQELGALGVLHRGFPSTEEYLNEVKKLTGPNRAASVGVGKDQVKLATELYELGINIIALDVAHGFTEVTRNTAVAIKEQLPNVKLIVGNVINIEALYYFNNVADCLKLVIGSGSHCSTKLTAGCYEKSWSVLQNFKLMSRRYGMPIISDGGHKNPSDVVKALGAGATSCMMGRQFAMCPESAAPLTPEGKKIYAGMASTWTQNQWKGGLKPGTCSEGVMSLLDVGQPVADLIERYTGAIRSGFSYAGARNLKEFQDKVRFVRFV